MQQASAASQCSKLGCGKTSIHSSFGKGTSFTRAVSRRQSLIPDAPVTGDAGSLGTSVNQLQVQYNCRLATRGRSAYGPPVVLSPHGGWHVTVVIASRCDQRPGASNSTVVLTEGRHVTVFILHDRRPIGRFYRSQQFRECPMAEEGCARNLQRSFLR